MKPTASRAELKERLARVPEKPGVYIHKDDQGNVLYIGKAVRLRSRLKYYFNAPAKLPQRTSQMVLQIADFDYLLTNSDQEALLLENNLIKQHKPRYNARLKDDKSFPFIKFDLGDDFPRIYVTRHPTDSKARYFGPYASAGSVHRTLRMLKRTFPYRSCTKHITGTDQRPCLEYFIKRCVAPCTGYADRETYRDVVSQAMNFLEHGTGPVMARLKDEMRHASRAQNYERAAVLRDRLNDLQNLSEKQHVAGIGTQSFDAIASAPAGDKAVIELFFVRGGNLIGHDRFQMTAPNLELDGELDIVRIFIAQYYAASGYVPPLVLTNNKIVDAAVLEKVLSSKRGGKVKLSCPQRGSKRHLVQLAEHNATHAAKQMCLQTGVAKQFGKLALSELREYLCLPRQPVRIECYDVSHVQGAFTVAAMVVFENAQPKPADYRRFKIRHSRNDDFASMREVIARRVKKIGGGPAHSFGARPDLILIDGGKGQLNSVGRVLLDAGLTDIATAAIAKRHELIFVPAESEPIDLPSDSAALKLVQRLRDEAHRFAVTYHRKRRTAHSVRSALDDIPQIGPKRKQALIRHFGSVAIVRDANIVELATVRGMTMRLAQTVKEHL